LLHTGGGRDGYMDTGLLESQSVSKATSLNGIDVYRIDTGKFKTNTINIFFIDNISRENASRNALVPAVLRRGCKKFPAFRDIALYLEELYGASFDCGVTKKGEQQVIQFYIGHVADTYTGKEAELFEKSFDLLFEIVTNPVLEDGAFKKEYVEQEKVNLRRLIESRVNDKVQYSIDRCFEEMCKDEPFGIYDYGSVEGLEQINESGLYEHYRTMLETFPMKVFVSGLIEDKKLQNIVNRLSQIKRGSTKKIVPAAIYTQVEEVRNVVEKMDVNQGKLTLGFRTNTSPEEKDYYSLIVYSGILGGGIHSKLFRNVREKASLAYYIFSRLERFKGLMVISSGIEPEKKDTALQIIMEQLDEITKGNISDYEYGSTLKTIETGLKALKDSQIQVVDFYLSQLIAGTDDSFESMVEKIRRVTKQDVINVAEKVGLDTVYFLSQG
jgi:predicted Zn-dependent peptidase